MEEAEILALAPSPDAFDRAASLVRSQALKNLRRNEGGDYLWADCEGSGADPYAVSADLAGEKPRLACSCPSRRRPCKHALALLVALSQDESGFEVAEPPDDLERNRTKAAAPKKPKKKKAGKKSAASKAAEEKKARAQVEGLDIADQVLADLATSGLGTVDEARREALGDRAKELADFYLPGVAVALRRLSLILAADDNPDMQRARAARQLARLTTMVRKGRALLEHKLEDAGETDTERDALLEEILGKVWHLTELEEKGFVRKKLELVELAYVRADDAARDERVETSHLLDLESGQLLRDVAYVPAKRKKRQPPKPSYGHLEVENAAVYPGFANPRVRWEKGAATERPLTADDCARACEKAVPIAEATARFLAQAKDLLAPDTAIALVKTRGPRLYDDGLVLEDAEGSMIALRRLGLGESSIPAMRSTGWPRTGRAALVELSIHPFLPEIVAAPMALLADDGLVRLCR